MAARRGRGTRSGSRLFLVYALVSLLPMLGLGLVLVRSAQRAGQEHGLAQGRAQAAVIVQMAIAPALGPDDLRRGLTNADRARLHRATDLATYSGSLTALRLRTFAGTVVFADDGSTTDPIAVADTIFVDAAAGHTTAAVVRDPNGRGGSVIRVLTPVIPNATGQATGVLELYLPFASIAAAVHSEERQTYERLTLGLLSLWLILGVIAWSTTRRLRRYAAEQAHQALHDPLTGLPNRSCFREHAHATIEAAGDEGGAIVLIDLNGFKKINDTLGHHAGDDLLKIVAQRLAGCLRTDDLVARLGGDEFGLLLPGVRDPQVAVDMLAKVSDAVRAPIDLDGATFAIAASFGVALYPDHSRDLAQLLIYADTAMYQGKRGPERIVVYLSTQTAPPARIEDLVSNPAGDANRDPEVEIANRGLPVLDTH